MGKQLLSLSLFIVLLAFFILLNGVSSFDEGKVRDTINSVGFAFGTKIEALAGFEGEETSESQDYTNMSEGEGTVFERMQALFSAKIPGHKSVVSTSQGVLHVTLPLEELETSINETLAAGEQIQDDELGDYLILTLVALMNRLDDGEPYRLDMIYNIPESPADMQNDSPQELETHIRRLSALSNNIEEIGLPEHLMSAGISKGNPENIDLFFRLHETYEVQDNASGPR